MNKSLKRFFPKQRPTREQGIDAIQELIDAFDVPTVLQMVSKCCMNTAKIVKNQYGDKEAALLWIQDAQSIDHLSYNLDT